MKEDEYEKIERISIQEESTPSGINRRHPPASNAHGGRTQCAGCGGSGLVFKEDSKGYQTTFACYCPNGDVHCEFKYRPGDKKKEHPFQMQRIKPPKVVNKYWEEKS